MDLKISLDDTRDCFVSLPSAVAASLSSMEPFAPLSVLTLTQHPSRPPIHLAWAGRTCTARTLGLHPHLAATLGLRKGQPVTARLALRVPTGATPHAARTVTLRPVAYDDHAPATAWQSYEMLVAAARILERSLLAQLRILYVGFQFPLWLPGRDALVVRVTALEFRDGVRAGAAADDAAFGMLVPDTEVTVETPPVPPPDAGEGEGASVLKSFYRVLPLYDAMARQLPKHLFLSHAILPPSDVRAAAALGLCAIVCRKEADGERPALPVAVAFHAAVPPGHLLLPPHLWADLRITPFAPVLLKGVAPPADVQGALCLDRIAHGRPGDGEGSWAGLEEFCVAAGVVYDGMVVRDGRVRVEGPEASFVRNGVSGGEDVWDRESAPGEKGDDVHLSGVTFATLGVRTHKEELSAVESTMQVIKGFKTRPEQAFDTRESDRTVTSRDEASVFAEEYHPLLDGEVYSTLWKSMAESCRQALHQLMRLTPSVFAREKPTCKAAVLEGPLGCGKTHTARTVAALLRKIANVRTIWIRCRRHEGEELAQSIDRVEHAFHAAVDGGPGAIVMDDIDALFGSKSIGLDRDKDPNSTKNDRRRRLLAQYLESQFREPRNNSVLLLMTCTRASDLEINLRCPGVISKVVSLSLPEVDDRSWLYWAELRKLNVTGTSTNSDDYVRREAVRIGEMTEGYSPWDIKLSLVRARFALASNMKEFGNDDVEALLGELRNVVQDLTPSSRAGISFSSTKDGEILSWSKLGGLENAKRAIWETLQLPSQHRDVFKNVPIRLPHGLLLYGPPGCGKTALARTAAAESGMRCVMVKGPELLSKYIGESEAEVRRAFEKASKSTPCVLLFDEFDSLAPRRGGESTGVADRVVNTLLSCMDGAERLSEGVYVIATTSRPELIDPALLRPGRLDRWIPVDIPSTAAERLEILRSLFPDTSNVHPSILDAVKHIAESAEGYTGADLGSILNDAYMSSRKKKSRLSQDVSMSAEDLLCAFRHSRPSISMLQRRAFSSVMLRFAPQNNISSNGKGEGSLSRPENVGLRVALK